MIKIVFFNATMEMGGPARVINLWSNYFVNNEHEVEIVSNINVPLFYDFDKRVKYSILGIDKFKQKSKIKTIFKIYNFLRNRKNEVLIFNKGLYVSYLFTLKKMGLIDKSLKLVYIAHGGSSDFKTMYNSLLNYMINYTFDNIIALIDDYDNYNKRILMSKKRKIVNAIIPEYFSEIRKKITYIVNPVTFRSDIIPTYNEKVVLAVGRLDYIKGFDLLIESWKSIAKEYPQWKLKIVGSGDEKLALENQIKDLSLEKYIEMIPQQKDVKSLYLNSSISVMSSREEGFGMVTIEAMECGLPIVAFKNVGSLFLVKDNKNGLLCDIGDIEQLAINIKSLIADKSLRERMGKKSKELVKEFYIENIEQKWKPILGLNNE